MSPAPPRRLLLEDTILQGTRGAAVSEARPLRLTASGRLGLADLSRLGRSLVAAAERGDVDRVVVDLRTVSADLATLDVLARLQLVARRHRQPVSFAHAPLVLRDLLTSVGLDEVVPLAGSPSAVEAAGQPEAGEEPVGVEEGVHRHDAPTGDLEDL